MPPENTPAKTANKLTERLTKIQARGPQPDLLSTTDALPAGELLPAVKEPKPKVSRSKKAISAAQGDFFTPVLYDVGTRDSRDVMDVAVFRLSKKDKRANSEIRYDLSDGHVVVSSGVNGMASVWDYDIVLMAISHLTEAMNRYRDGKGDKPGQVFRPHISDVLKFCRRDNGGNQKDAVVGALQRLSTTFVAIERESMLRGKLVNVSRGENLISGYQTISNAKTDKVEFVEIKISDSLYERITKGSKPDVLTVHPDYFLSESGIGRFVYRLARKAAGKDTAAWGFSTIYERSGSTGTLKEFTRALRQLIADDEVPEYSLAEEQGQKGPVLRMVHRSQADKWKESPPPPAAEDTPQ